MNYRHIFHAGNFADVLKHTILCMLLEHLKKKDKGFLYLDTHAGIARYTLTSDIAQKTCEYLNGIAKIYHLATCPPAIKTYQNIVRAFNDNNDMLQYYPGSPQIAAALLRPQDHMILAELHPEDVQTLKSEFAGNQQVAVHHIDGYQSIKAFLPPKTGRGLILIDPPFEAKDEFTKIADTLTLAAKRFPQGIYAIWFPIKDLNHVKNFVFKIKELELKDGLFIKFAIGKLPEEAGLTSCGMLILNAPWKFSDELQPVIAWLTQTLALDASAAFRINTLF